MIIKGKKVNLRTVRLSDAENFVKWFNDPEVNKFVFVRQMNLKEEKKFIRERLKGKTKQNQVFFCIDTKDGVHIGSTSLEIKSQRLKVAGFGIIVGDKNYWNQGYGTEAARLILDYGFTNLKLHRVDLDVYDYNKRALKVYKKLGFKVEGRKRETNLYNGKYYDAIYMGMLSREWNGIKT